MHMEAAATMLTRGLIRALTILLLAAAGACALVHRTIEMDNGDTIDCVDIYQQPALIKHALPGSREIQAKPKWTMKAMAAAANASKSKLHLERPQAWRRYGSCPEGTVPIRRGRAANPHVNEQLARRASPFGRPGGDRGSVSSSTTDDGDLISSTILDGWKGKVEVAAVYAMNGPYLGARADVPYWRVDVQQPNEFSMNYILVGNTLDDLPPGSTKPPASLTNQIAVGLVAWPALFGDSLSRLFVYYSTDGGTEKNCFNLDCGGFHVHESEYALGDSWADSDSQVGGRRFFVTLGIHRDTALENWWVTVMDEEIGYYPESVFNTRFSEAVYVEMGGRVLDTRPGGNHTTTPMGSGMPACGGSRFAAAIMEYLGVSYDGTLFNDAASSVVTTTPSCYGANPLGFHKTRAGYNSAYGGPGGIFCDQQE